MNLKFRLAALAVVIALAACTSGETDAVAAPGENEPVRETSVPDVMLTNTYWKLVELNGAPVEPGEGKELHMILRGEGQVGGYAGCNQFTGSVTVSGDGISFGPIASTRRMCPDTMQQEDAFLQALEQASRYVVTGEDLDIENGNGEVTMRFVAVYME